MKTRKLIGVFSIAAMAALALTGCSLSTNSDNNANEGTSQTDPDTGTDTGTGTDTSTGTNTGTDPAPVSGGGSSSGGSSSGTDATTIYTVTFDTNGGTSVSSTTVAENGVLSQLPTTKKDGFTFDGWYSNAACTDLFTTTTVVKGNITLYAKWTAIQAGDVMTATYGYSEGLYAVFNETNPASTAIKVEVKKSGDPTYTRVDNNLVRTQAKGSTARVDVVGLAEGTYDLKITNSNGVSQVKASISVSRYDRSGYAHFKTPNEETGVSVSDGIGAYKNDGTLKENAVVVYVDDSTKNTVKATIKDTEYIGLFNIINGATSASVPLDVRIIGTINQKTWNKIEFVNDGNMKTVRTNNGVANVDPLANGLITYNGEVLNATVLSTLNETGKIAKTDRLSQAEIIALGKESDGLRFNGNEVASYQSEYTTIDGVEGFLKYSSKEYDSYWNMMDIKNAKNITVEGIGDNAGLNQWGFTWKLCSSVEVKNLTFDSATEDACAIEGAADSTTIAGFKDGNIWIHNNTFNVGFNNLDVSSEQDKHEGDGCTDIKKTAFVTLSYNRYYKTHKTGLVNGSDTQHAACITFHHNYYDQCESRLPFARQANMHMYNNYYAGSTGNNMQIYAGAYAFIEGCYFENAKNTFSIKTGNNQVAAVKLYNNVFTGISSTNGATVVDNRTTAVENGNIYNPNFDTDTTDFYYDAKNHVSNVEYLTSAEQAKSDCIAYAGAGTMTNVTSGAASSNTDNTTTDTTQTSPATDTNTDTPTTDTNTDTPTASGNTTYSLDCSTVTSISNLGDDYTVVDSGDAISLSNGAIKLGSNGSNADKYIGITVSGTGTVTVEVTAYINTSAVKPYAYLAVQKDSEDATSESITSGDAVTYTYTFTVSGTSTFYIYRSSGSGTGVLVTSIVTTYTAS